MIIAHAITAFSLSSIVDNENPQPRNKTIHPITRIVIKNVVVMVVFGPFLIEVYLSNISKRGSDLNPLEYK